MNWTQAVWYWPQYTIIGLYIVMVVSNFTAAYLEEQKPLGKPKWGSAVFTTGGALFNAWVLYMGGFF